MLIIQPITIADAKRFVDQHHRHHRAPQGAKFAIGVNDGDKLVGVILVGRPVARALDNGWTAEVSRCCTDGTKNAASMLYGAAWRAARAMGYKRLITYTRYDEPGVSLLAANWRCVGQVQGKTWDTPKRPRTDKTEVVPRQLWEMT